MRKNSLLITFLVISLVYAERETVEKRIQSATENKETENKETKNKV